MKRVGLIGCGGIGRPVARALLAGQAGAHSLAAVLGRSSRDLDGFPVTAANDDPRRLAALSPGPASAAAITTLTPSGKRRPTGPAGIAS